MPPSNPVPQGDGTETLTLKKLSRPISHLNAAVCLPDRPHTKNTSSTQRLTFSSVLL